MIGKNGSVRYLSVRMNGRIILLLAALLAASPGMGAEPAASRVAAARQVLASYHAVEPKPAHRKLHVVCWRTRDRDFPADQRARLQAILEDIRDFYAAEMERNGLGRLTFQLDYDKDGRLVVHQAAGHRTYDEYTKQGSGGEIREDCVRVLRMAGIDPDRETILIFTNLGTWDPVALTFSHHSPYMGGGSCRAGTCWQVDHAGLAVSNLALKAPLIRDGEYGRISLGKHNSIFIGGIAHELGHALGLPHCTQTEEESQALGTSLMGSGNRTYGDQRRGEGKGSFLTPAGALQLASHPMFSGSAKGLDTDAKAVFSALSVLATNGGFVLSGVVTGSVPVHALAAYLDPAGHDDYDARTVCAIPDPDGRFTLPAHHLVAGRPAELRLKALLANGDVDTFSQSYRVAKDGTPDVSVMAVRFALDGFLSALATNRQQAAAILRTLPAGSSRHRIASLVFAGTAGTMPQHAPASLPPGQTSIPLSHVAPEEARVGWGRPAYDHLPRPDALLIAGGELFDTGIYAHAPALHRYDLSGGWKRLTGTCGLPQGGGSVVFVIRADGKELLRTKTIRGGGTQSFSLDIAGARELELITEDAGDGRNSDWGCWFHPELTR